MRFFDRILGAFTAAPMIDAPVMKMPHAAPITQRVSASVDPRLARKNGSTVPMTSNQSTLFSRLSHVVPFHVAEVPL